ncbi:Rac prophage; protein [Escherichia coli]|uniref:Rac prophage protein n=1 Tax=Escherichia coli TaxID=562 RepID=A0A376MVM8_ECOLX|nr:Rac prophage; protein [Escherichia coli]
MIYSLIMPLVYLLKDWKGVGELVNGVEVALEYTAERGIALLKQNPELYWQILAEAASIAQGKEQAEAGYDKKAIAAQRWLSEFGGKGGKRQDGSGEKLRLPPIPETRNRPGA